MKKFFGFFSEKHDEIYKGALLVVSIVLIVMFYPKQIKFKYNLENLVGKPWPHEDLIAQFDFAISKSDDEIKKDKEDVLANSLLYFRIDENVAGIEKENFLKEIEDGFQDEKIRSMLRTKGKILMDTLYRRGIIQLHQVIENKDSKFVIAIIKNNEEVTRPVSYFFTIKTASDYVSNYSKENSLPEEFAEAAENHISQNIFYDEKTSQLILKQQFDKMADSKGGRVKGQSIIAKGEIVTPEKFEVLNSMKKEYEKQTGGTSNYFFVLIGQVAAVTVCMVLLAIFIYVFRREFLMDNLRVVFILLLIVLMNFTASLAINYGVFNFYILPFCLVPIIIRAFYDTRVALFVHLTTLLIVSIMLPERFEFLFVEWIAGLAALFSIVSFTRRSQIFISAFAAFVAYGIAFGSLMLIKDARMQDFSTEHLIAFTASSAMILFAYPLIYLFEKIFDFISDMTLMELSDTNSPLLRELATKAPGTFQHSLQVADLAEEVVRNIGGNALLIRTGALYHDIGKTDMPMYFIENQVTGYNPHTELDFEESAQIIISHVIKGVEKARKAKVPEAVIEFIRTHHGTTTTKFFFRQYKIMNPEGTASEDDFRYPGPIPFSKETAVLMLSDSVEASARSLKKHDQETIDTHVETIVNSLVAQNQFINSNITFRDITVSKKIFKKKLMNIYHSRIEYPN